MTRKLPIWSLYLAAAVAFMVAAPPVSAQATASASSSTQDAVADGVVAFYFHGNVRCATCRKIEAYADEAIHSSFAAAFPFAWEYSTLMSYSSPASSMASTASRLSACWFST